MSLVRLRTLLSRRRHTPRAPKHGERGFGLVESLVSVGIAATGLMAVAGLLAAGAGMQRNSRDGGRAGMAAMQQLEVLRMLPSTDARVHAVVRPQVDPRTRDRDARDERVDKRLLLADESEDCAVVIRVGVDVEHVRRRRERGADRVDHAPVPPLREVRHGFERQRHPAYSRRPARARTPRTMTIRKSSYRSLASLQQDTARCRACAEAGFPLESLPVRAPGAGQRAYLFGQAPGVVEGEERLPWRGRAGRTLRRWLELEEDEFYATFYCASVTRCYPGRAASGRGDRTPTPREQELCSFWRDWELELLRPRTSSDVPTAP